MASDIDITISFERNSPDTALSDTSKREIVLRLFIITDSTVQESAVPTVRLYFQNASMQSVETNSLLHAPNEERKQQEPDPSSQQIRQFSGYKRTFDFFGHLGDAKRAGGTQYSLVEGISLTDQDSNPLPGFGLIYMKEAVPDQTEEAISFTELPFHEIGQRRNRLTKEIKASVHNHPIKTEDDYVSIADTRRLLYYIDRTHLKQRESGIYYAFYEKYGYGVLLRQLLDSYDFSHTPAPEHNHLARKKSLALASNLELVAIEMMNNIYITTSFSNYFYCLTASPSAETLWIEAYKRLATLVASKKNFCEYDIRIIAEEQGILKTVDQIAQSYKMQLRVMRHVIYQKINLTEGRNEAGEYMLYAVDGKGNQTIVIGDAYHCRTEEELWEVARRVLKVE